MTTYWNSWINNLQLVFYIFCSFYYCSSQLSGCLAQLVFQSSDGVSNSMIFKIVDNFYSLVALFT